MYLLIVANDTWRNNELNVQHYTIYQIRSILELLKPNEIERFETLEITEELHFRTVDFAGIERDYLVVRLK